MTTQTVKVPIVGDTLSEPTEFFFLKLSRQPVNATLADDSGACGVKDNDLGGMLRFHVAADTVQEDAKYLTVQVDRVSGAASGLTVHVATLGGGPWSWAGAAFAIVGWANGLVTACPAR